jgi:UDP-N-acetylmuramoyl-L-alanyl-D-glutamate--2,6-diaminopimelate ligase
VPKTAVLNRDDASFGHLAGLAYDRRLVYGLGAEADVHPRDVELDGRGTRFVAVTPAGEMPIESRLLGEFNVHNALAAISAAVALRVPSDAIQRGLGEFRGVPGRLEAVDRGQPFGVVVDFAHTPNSLRRVLELGRRLAQGKVAVVFGCAGLRDVAKRPLMGRAAGELADRVYLTAEDPRTEDLGTILAQIAAGVRAGGKEPQLLPDRVEAIRRALAEAQPGDLVLITGKGHEQTMCFGTEERPWNDHAAAVETLTRLGYGG